jgi:tetratricopeptide (TPR) repeat protein
MSEEKRLTELEFHKKMGVDLFNLSWELLDKPDRTPEETDRLVHAVHASRYHWGVHGAPVNLARGEQMCSHVYALLGRAEPALHHARRCLELCEANGIGDFDLAFAHEALTRSLALAGHGDEARASYELAEKAAAGIAKDEDREYFLGQLRSIKLD